MVVRARSSDIGGPYGVSKGIFSGTKSRGLASVGCKAGLTPAALVDFPFGIHPPVADACRIRLDNQENKKTHYSLWPWWHKIGHSADSTQSRTGTQPQLTN